MTKYDGLINVVIWCDEPNSQLDNLLDSVTSQSYGNFILTLLIPPRYNKKITEIAEIRNIELTCVCQSSKHSKEHNVNDAISKTESEYVICLDVDDIIDKDYFREAIDHFNSSDRKIGFVSSWFRYIDNIELLIKVYKQSLAYSLLENNIHTGSIFKREAWKSVGGYKYNLGAYSAWSFWISIIESGYDYKIIESDLFFCSSRKDLAVHGEDVLYGELIDLHKKTVSSLARDIANIAHGQMLQLKSDNINYESEIDDYISAIKELQSRVNQLEEDNMSRLVGWTIQFRKKLVATRCFITSIPRRVISGLMKLLAFILPGSIKEYLKNIKKQHHKRVIISNNKWNSNKPLVSIVTPYFNQSKTIKDTIDSVLSQTFDNFEYIIVNDGSVDRDTKILTEIINSIDDSRVKIINYKTNKGQGSPANARNDGINHSRGKYIICLDGDDMLDPTYMEKCLIVLETYPAISIATTNMNMFGAGSGTLEYREYNPRLLLSNNLITTAAMFRKKAWQDVGGYKHGIGYEDWEMWVNMAEHGHFAKLIPEGLFNYRVSAESRYTEDKKKHRDNVNAIKTMHPRYFSDIRSLWRDCKKRLSTEFVQNAFVNIYPKLNKNIASTNRKSILMIMPWMMFGGAETLMLNMCGNLKHRFDFHFFTGLKSNNTWEHRFREISNKIYHLANLSISSDMVINMASNYIRANRIRVVHIVHTDYLFYALPELKIKHPDVKFVVTMFNDKVKNYFMPSVELSKCIDVYTSDNMTTVNHYIEEINDSTPVINIPNGVDCYQKFNPAFYSRDEIRHQLGLNDKDLAVFFIGRLSPEKAPDSFIKMAKMLIKDNEESIKFFVIGDGAMHDEIIKMIGDDNSNISYLGYQTDIPRYLSAADIFVLTSITEGFPLSVLEAMSMKVVTIASRVGGVPDIIEDGVDGIIIDPASSAQAKDAVSKINHDRNLLYTMKLNARNKIIKKYSNDILGSNYTDLYREIMK